MTVTLEKAMEKREAELRGQSKGERCTVEAEKSLIRDSIPFWLDVELPDDTEICIEERNCPNGYHLDIKLPAADYIISLRRRLIPHKGFLFIWPLSESPLWRVQDPGGKSGTTQDFSSFVDAALYACRRARIDDEGNLELRL